jgi:hypothetical protein
MAALWGTVLTKSGDGHALAAHLRLRLGLPVGITDTHPHPRPPGTRPLVPSVPLFAAPRVIVDGVGLSALAASAKGRGTPVVGADPVLERWETVRATGLEQMARAGLRIPPTTRVPTLASAIARLRDPALGDETVYFKPDGDVPKALTLSAPAPMLAEVLAWLQHEPVARKIRGGVLQERIEGGTEVDCSYYLARGVPIAATVTLEEKRLLAGNQGPATGCQLSLQRFLPLDHPLVGASIGRVLPWLADVDYSGPLDLNMIATTAHGPPFGLEWTARFGWDATQGDFMLLGPEAPAFLDALAERDTVPPAPPSDWSLTVRLAMPGLDPEERRALPSWTGYPLPSLLSVLGSVAAEPVWFWPDDVWERPDGTWVSGPTGILGVLSVRGTRLETMAAQLEGVLRELRQAIPMLVARTDVTGGFAKRLGALQHLGLLRPGDVPEDARIVPASPAEVTIRERSAISAA